MNRANAKDLEGRIDQNATVFYQNGQPYTGIVYEEFQGRINLEYEVNNGVKQGRETEFYPNGTIQSVSHYADNVLDGELINYYENGAVEERAIFEKGVCIQSDSYDEAGPVIENFTISKESAEYPWLNYLRQQENA